MNINNTISFYGYFVCLSHQAGGSPLIDPAHVREKDPPNRQGKGWLIRLPYTGGSPTIGLTFGKWETIP